jgi:hypothetical protein
MPEQKPDFQPPDTLDVKALADILRKRNKKAVRRKREWGTDDKDLDRREPHPFDE